VRGRGTADKREWMVDGEIVEGQWSILSFGSRMYARTRSARGEFEKEQGKREEEMRRLTDVNLGGKRSGHCFASDTGG
jgi:hypothetical protein